MENKKKGLNYYSLEVIILYWKNKIYFYFYIILLQLLFKVFFLNTQLGYIKIIISVI